MPVQVRPWGLSRRNKQDDKMGFSSHTFNLEDQVKFPFLPSVISIEVQVGNISFSAYCPATYDSPAEGGDLEDYDIEGISVCDEDGDEIPLTATQIKLIADWAHGQSDLEDAICSADYSDYYDDYDYERDRSYDYYS